MNIPRYVLPVSIAAAFHAALFWSMQGEKPPRIVAHLIEITNPPSPPQEEPVTLPPEEKSLTSEPVKPLASQPAPPDIPDQPVTPKPEVITTPIVPQHLGPQTKLNELPRGLPSDFTGATGPGTVTGIHVFTPGQLDHTPRARVQRAPDYPPNLSRQGVGGSVTVEFDVNTRGEVVRADALNYTQREFVEPALRAVRSWRFEPGRRDGQAVPFRMVIPIEFGIESS